MTWSTFETLWSTSPSTTWTTTPATTSSTPRTATTSRPGRSSHAQDSSATTPPRCWRAPSRSDEADRSLRTTTSSMRTTILRWRPTPNWSKFGETRNKCVVKCYTASVSHLFFYLSLSFLLSLFLFSFLMVCATALSCLMTNCVVTVQ